MHLLRQPRLALLFTGGALNAIGTWATLIALWGFSTSHFHAGANGVALVGLAWSLPGAVLGPLAGWPIDRFGARPVMIASDLVGVAAALAMAGAGSFSTLVLLTLATGAVQAFGRPAATSLAPRLVDDDELLAANALLGVAAQSAIIFGPLAGSLAISLWGLRAAFLFDAATFVVGAAAVVPLRIRPAAVTGRPSPRDLAGGLRVAWTVVDVRRVLALTAVAFSTWGAFFVIEPLYVREVLHRSPAVLGFLQTSFGVGLVATTALLPRLGRRIASVPVIAGAVAASGLVAALYVGTHHLAVALVGVTLWGVDVAFFTPPMQTVLQRATPPDAHGRVMALASTLNGVGNLVGIPLAGAAVGAFGVSPTGAIVGGVALVAGGAGLAVSTRAPRRAGRRSVELRSGRRTEQPLEGAGDHPLGVDVGRPVVG